MSKKKIFDMGKNLSMRESLSTFIPELWSKEFTEKFFDKTNLGVPFTEPEHIMKSVARRIEDLRGKGVSDGDIEKDVEGYIAGLQEKEKSTVKIGPWKGFSFIDYAIHS